jgi:RND family efflux transporter MFP subunit
LIEALEEDRMQPRIVASALALVASVACAKPDAHAPTAAPISTKVSVATAHIEPFAALYRASGTVRGRNTTVLTSKVTGYVRAVRVHSGDGVTAGQTLVELEANDVRAGVARARALLDQSTEAKAEAENALQAARAGAKIAKSSYDRADKLLKDDAIPQQQFDEAEARWQSADAEERAAEARVRAVTSRIAEAKAGVGEARATLDYADIVAPFSGRVLERRVDPGALAAPGTPLLVVADEGTLRVEVPVEESRANSVRVGDEADIDIETAARSFTGKVAEIVPTVDVASRAFLVKLDLPTEAGAFRSGSFARVSFHLGTQPRLVVPTTAVTVFGALDRVFIADGGHARLRMITIGDAQGPWTEVLSGLSAGERILTAPPPGLRDGAPIEERQ